MALLKKLFRPSQRADLLIVGLGNPGKEYVHTPHNAGFEVLDLLRSLFQERGILKDEQHLKEYSSYTVRINEQDVLFVRPLLFMNNSGRVVRNVFQTYQIPSTRNLWVVHDDVDLPLSTMRVGFDSSSAGNKGVQDIIDMFQSKEFYRFRIGVRPNEEFYTKEFITKKLQPTQLATHQETVQKCAFIILESLTKTPEPFLNKKSI